MAKAVHRSVGHPPTGLKAGDKLSEYQRVTIRLPDDVRTELEAAGLVLGRPQWRIVIEALHAYFRGGISLTDDERRRIQSATRAAGRTRQP